MFIGIDNGVSGAVAIVDNTGGAVDFWPMPVKKDLSYTQKAQWVTRVDVKQLRLKFRLLAMAPTPPSVWFERPMINPQRFKATVSAIRAYEATLIALESLSMGVSGYLDSRKWQKLLLPSGCSGAELKSASRIVGCRIFPQFKEEIEKHGDADALLIALYAQRTNTPAAGTP